MSHSNHPQTTTTPHGPTGVLVVGGGIMGLSAAYQLLRGGFPVTLVADSFDSTTSHVAGASIVPSSSTPIDEQPRVLQWGQHTSSFLATLRQQIGSAASGVSFVSGYEYWPTRIPLPFWSPMMHGMRDVEQKEIEAVLGVKEAKQYEYAWFFTTIHVDTAIYMAYLRGEIQRMGGRIIPARIESLTALRVAVHYYNSPHSNPSSPSLPSLPAALIGALRHRHHFCVVNCSGLGARHLVPDAQVYPCKGIVLRVKKCPPLLAHAYGSELRGSYTIPRLTDTTVGGSFGIGDESFDIPPNELERLLTEASKFVPDVARVDRETDVSVMVGHRPNRTRIRLPMPITLDQPNEQFYSRINEEYVDQLKAAEATRLAARTPNQLDWDNSSRVKVPIIHNYGHGGSGITLHMGCAIEVLQLAKKIQPPSATMPISSL
jgi:glycine/D-amino acid oxidase-like deaminating enzyme